MSATKAQDVILELLRNTDGEWTGKKRLFKAFYFAHLYYAQEKPGLLTNWPIARMPEGPGIDQSDLLFNDLVMEGLLTIERIHEGPYPEFRYRLTSAGLEAAPPVLDARQAIGKAAEFCRGKTGAQLSELTHEHSRSWKEGKAGELLNIYIDIIPDDEYEKGRVAAEQLGKLLPELFEGELA